MPVAAIAREAGTTTQRRYQSCRWTRVVQDVDLIRVPGERDQDVGVFSFVSGRWDPDREHEQAGDQKDRETTAHGAPKSISAGLPAVGTGRPGSSRGTPNPETQSLRMVATAIIDGPSAPSSGHFFHGTPR